MGKKILGYPVCIDSKTYNRNAFYFNLCFVFSPPVKTLGYEPVIKKLTEYLVSGIYLDDLCVAAKHDIKNEVIIEKFAFI